jgi:hypothetical protein
MASSVDLPAPFDRPDAAERAGHVDRFEHDLAVHWRLDGGAQR